MAVVVVVVFVVVVAIIVVVVDVDVGPKKRTVSKNAAAVFFGSVC